ncbi:MAG: hypothetical protein EA362_03910 [Saprospirales bacterium]|nr:MAG: hypothetical protein EA362_03910 [Saprospirales bacterium]
MKMNEKFNIKEEGEMSRRYLVSSFGTVRDVEERFCPITKISDFVAICNRKGFSEWTHQVMNAKDINLADINSVEVNYKVLVKLS